MAVQLQRAILLRALGPLGLLVAATTTAAPQPPPAGVAPRSPQVMLYVTHSIGGGGAAGFSKPTFGLRVQQVRQVSNSGDPEGGDAMSRRDLLDWQLQAHHDLRVVFGHRLTYDLTNRTFGSPEQRSAMSLTAANIRRAAESPPTGNLGSAQKPVSGRMEGFPRNAFRDSATEPSAFREIASAAISALAPSRLPAQRTTGQRQLAGHRDQASGAATR